MIKYDATDEKCPIPLVKTKRLLKSLSRGHKLEVLLRQQVSANDISRWLKMNQYTFQINHNADITSIVIEGKET